MGELIGKTISHYTILQQIGSGGMGVLYLAEDTQINRKAVLKFLPENLNNDNEINLRFKREAQAAGSLSHPNIVTIYDVGVHEDKTFIAMEYVEGKTLREIIDDDELTIEQIKDVSIQICEGLHEAHSKGITHRDIKPENILIDGNGKVKIVDFGLAKTTNATKELTKKSSTLGTIKYMSPEQIRNQKVDQRTDIWSFGVILYEMITGRYPFKGEHDASLFYSIINQTPEPLARFKSNISESFQRIIDKALNKEPKTRYQHIDDVLSDFRRVEKEGEPSKKTGIKYKRIITYIISLLFVISILFEINYFLNNKSRIFTPPKHTQLTFNGHVKIDYFGDLTQISPDGKYTAYVVDKGNEQTIYVRENLSERSYQIYDVKQIMCLRWAPNSNEIFFSASILDSNKTLLKIPRNFSCFIISKFGGKVEPLHDWMNYGCWSPDGSSLALIYMAQDSIRIINRRIQEREKTIKLNGDYTKFLDIDWALIGNRFVCLTFNDKDKKNVLWNIKTDGTDQKKLIETENEIYSPRWSPDGKNVYYLQKNNESRDLMKIRISDEISEDNPKVIYSGLEAYGISLTGNNKKLAYTKYFGFSNVWKLSFDKGKKSHQQINLTDGTNSFGELIISPDNKKIAFVEKGKIFVKSINRGETKQISSGDFECSSPSWSPDGKDIAFFSGPNIIIADIHEGIVQRKIKNLEFGSSLYWSTDSILIYSTLLDHNLYFYNMYTNNKKLLLKNDKNTGWIFRPRSSPKKEEIAVYWNRLGDETLDGLWIISNDDAVQNHLFWQNIWPLKWTEDGKYIYAINFDKVPSEILKLSSKDGSIKEQIKIPFDDVWDADISSDGKIFICNVGEENSDVWMIENFDPDVE